MIFLVTITGGFDTLEAAQKAELDMEEVIGKHNGDFESSEIVDEEGARHDFKEGME